MVSAFQTYVGYEQTPSGELLLRMQWIDIIQMKINNNINIGLITYKAEMNTMSLWKKDKKCLFKQEEEDY